MSRHLYRILRAIGAATLLAAVLVGVPWALVIWGRSPLEGPGSLWDRLQEPASDTVVFGLLSWAAWAAWAAFALHVGVEVAVACGKSRPRVPSFGPVGLSARKLVTAITMSVTLAGPLTQRAGASPIPPPAATEIAPADNPVGATPAPAEAAPEPVAVDHPTTTHPRQAPPPPSSDADPSTPNDRAGTRQPTITVAPGDTPWGLAERHLGDGMRWREIWDRNRGVEQPDGHAWVCEDLIYPGWRFRLPGDATGLPQDQGRPTEGTGRQAPPSSTELPPEPSDTDEPPVTDSSAPSTTSTTEAPNRAESEPSGLPQAPEDTDGEIVTESESATTTTQPPSTSSTIPPIESNDTVPSPEPPADPEEGDEQQDEEGSAPVMPLLGAAAALLSVGVLRELRRRRTRATAPRPLRKAPPPSPQPNVEREVLLSADDDQADRLDAALVHLARSLRPRPGHDCAQPLVVQTQGQRVDVCMDRPDPAPPAPWRPEASGLVWVLDPEHEVPVNPDAIPPAPSLVTIGTDGDADILVHLEAHGVIALTGDEDMCRGVARSIVAELSTRAEGTVACTVIGDHLNELGASWDGVHHLDAWSDSDIGAIDGAARLLDTANWPHTWAARSSGRVFDGWPPTVFLSSHSDDPQFRQALEAASSRPGTGTAVIVLGGDPGCGLHIDIDSDGTFRCPQLHLTGAAQVLDADAATDLGDLLEHADDDPTDDDDDDGNDGALADILVERLPTEESPGRNGQDDTNGDKGSDAPVVVLDEFRDDAPAPQPDAPTPTYEDPAWDVLVHLCGEISIEGGRSDLGPREKAVVTYVALHGSTDFDSIQDAVWAGSAVTKKRLQNVISTARGSVGDALVLPGEGRIGAGTGLMTDLELIQRRTSYAKHQSDPVRRAEILRTGLALVTGKVCTCPPGGRRAWAWLELDSWISYAHRIVGTAASELAETYLTIEDCDGAAWAAKKGIEAIGRREELVILLVRSHEMAGDEQAARDVIREYEAWLADLGVDEHNEELLTLLERYAPPSRSKDHGSR